MSLNCVFHTGIFMGKKFKIINNKSNEGDKRRWYSLSYWFWKKVVHVWLVMYFCKIMLYISYKVIHICNKVKFPSRFWLEHTKNGHQLDLTTKLLFYQDKLWWKCYRTFFSSSTALNKKVTFLNENLLNLNSLPLNFFLLICRVKMAL